MRITDPILAQLDPTPRVIAAAVGGLHFIKGNTAPYFSLQLCEWKKGASDFTRGGADHGRIRELWGDRFADLAALHLSTIDGQPMHAVENGWYHLAGALGGAGERFHGGNSPRSFPDGYRNPSPEECLETFRDLWRLSPGEAARIRDKARGMTGAEARGLLMAEAADMASIWKMEADQCRERHGLVVYGDPWEPGA